jgi:hypothetical protein
MGTFLNFAPTLKAFSLAQPNLETFPFELVPFGLQNLKVKLSYPYQPRM